MQGSFHPNAEDISLKTQRSFHKKCKGHFIKNIEIISSKTKRVISGSQKENINNRRSTQS
jgi:hypothetical protein